MSARTRFVGSAIASLMVLSACSGGGGAASPAGSVGASAAASEAPSAAASADPSVDASPSTSAAASSEGGATGACALITAEEVEAATGVAVETDTNDTASCFYLVPETGAVVVATQLVTDGAASAFDSFKMNPQATVVAGIGDDAVWLPAYAATQLNILKGDSLLNLAVGTLSGVPIDEFPSDMTPEQLLAMTTALGKIAAARL